MCKQLIGPNLGFTYDISSKYKDNYFIMIYLKIFFVFFLCCLNLSYLATVSYDETGLLQKITLMGKLHTCITSGEPVSLDIVLF